jgi:perosamine synthetase
MYSIFLREGGEQQRDEVMRRLDELGIETRPVFYPMHVMPPYQENAAYPVADTWAQRGINLPTHQFLTEGEVARIANSLSRALSAV